MPLKSDALFLVSMIYGLARVSDPANQSSVNQPHVYMGVTYGELAAIHYIDTPTHRSVLWVLKSLFQSKRASRVRSKISAYSS